MAIAIVVVPAQAQVASHIVPQSFAPPVQGGLGGGLDVGAAPGLDTPPGAEKLFVTLRGIVIEGGSPPLPGRADDIRARLSGKRVSGAEIFAAARELEAAYARAGYVLVRVTLPRQKLVDGATLRLVVVDGFIERVEVKNLPERIRGRMAEMLAPLVGVRGLKLHDLERRILLAGDVPGVILRSALAPGSTLGATVLVIEANYQPVTTTLSADNTLSRLLGRWQVGVGFDFNSALGHGELVYVRGTADPNGGTNGFLSDYPRNCVLAAGVILPLGIDGLTFNVEGTLARTTPEATAGPSSTDAFQRLSARLRYPWLRSRNIDLASQIVFDVEDEKQSALLVPTALPLALDRVRVLRLLNEADYRVPELMAAPAGGPFTSLVGGGTLSGTLTPSFGLDALGARTAADATALLPLSVQNANATFAKLEGTLAYSQAFAEHLATSLSFHGQTSFGASLVRAEQIGLAGPGQLSSFEIGTLQGDSGYVGRAELQLPFALPPFAVLNALNPPGGPDIVLIPYGFVAGGAVFLQRPTALERSSVRAASYGGGLRIGAAGAGFLSNGQIAVEYGREARSDGLPDGNRFTLVSALRF